LTAGSLGARPDGLPFVSFTTDEIGSGDHKFDMGLTCVAYDFGDLNDLVAGTGAGNYETNLIDNGPFHQIVPGLSIGSTVDGELINVNPNAGATGDGADEDGFSFPSNLDITPGGTITLPIDVTNTTGTTAHLEIWIDWNGDGDFDDAGEMIANLSDNGSADFGSSSIVVNVPNGVATGQDLGFRARLSHEDDMTPNGQAFSGEVEDYIIQASCKTNICLPITIVKN